MTSQGTEFAGRIALVTGASRGIGYALSVALAREGAHVVAIARTVGGLEELDDAVRKGRIVFTLNGKKLKGGWVLVRTRGRQWLLMKRKDRYASSTVDITSTKTASPHGSAPSICFTFSISR